MNRDCAFVIALIVILGISVLTSPNQTAYNLNEFTSQFYLSDTRDVVWENVYDDTNCSRGMQLVQCMNDDFVTVGYTNNTGAGDFDGFLARFDPFGGLLWIYTYGGDSDDKLNSLVECQNGDFVLSGSTNSSGDGVQGWIVRTDSTGSVLWSIDHGTIYDDEFASAVECEDGGIALTGFVKSSSGDRDLWILKTNSTGHIDWEEIVVDSFFNQSGLCIIESDTGGCIVGGYYDEPYQSGADEPSQHALLYRTNPDGSLNTSQTFGGVNPNAFHSVIECIDGSLVALGYTSVLGFTSAHEEVFMVKTTSSLDYEWAQYFGGPDNEQGVSLTRCHDGGFALLCNTNNNTDNYYNNKTVVGDSLLIRTDAHGNQKWNMTYGKTDCDIGSSIVECVDGGYAAVGYNNGTHSDIWLFRIQPVQAFPGSANPVIAFGESLEYEIPVLTIGSGLNHTFLNDTLNFEIVHDNDSLIITNKTSLQVGSWGLDIWMNDTLGEFLSTSITITLEEFTETTSTSSTTTSVLPSSTTITSGLFGLDIQTLILIAGGIVVLIVLIVCIRARRR
ncbi:MAG: hypothetical protein RTU30_15655 [Candidatus Thorarchaeota archaeon]